MGKQPFISHAVNGYSRYDVPENKAFSVTPGIIYPVRIQFVNARDRVTLHQGIDVRSNPMGVPSFNPYVLRLHRFWVPLQLYHPEMRVNSSKFDMNNLTYNFFYSVVDNAGAGKYTSFMYPRAGTSAFFEQVMPFNHRAALPNSLMSWLRVANSPIFNYPAGTLSTSGTLAKTASKFYSVNADTYLGYWDIVRNFYSYSSWGVFSFAHPGTYRPVYYITPTSSVSKVEYRSQASYFWQRYGNLEFLDHYYETMFYPRDRKVSDDRDELTWDRSDLFVEILRSDLFNKDTTAPAPDFNKLVQTFPQSVHFNVPAYAYDVQEPTVNWNNGTGSDTNAASKVYFSATLSIPFLAAHPMAVCPSSPDRFSRLMPPGDSNSDVDFTGIKTIPQLAVATRLQEYKDLIGASGSRYSDWLYTFFASKIEHVDRPKLLFSSSVMVNSQVVMNQAGQSGFAGGAAAALGQMGGSIAFNTVLGREQTYYFKEPGYIFDMLTIRPVYFWTGIRPDYLEYRGADYFNPIYNDIGYQDVPFWRLGYGWKSGSPSESVTVAKEPCYNEFRSSYDEVLGSLQATLTPKASVPMQSYWVQQRDFYLIGLSSDPNEISPSMLFTNLNTVNNPFVSDMEDNFFVNMSYKVVVKNLVNKSFATRLSSR